MAPKIKYPVVDGRKECGTCHQWLPVSCYHKSRKHFVASCLGCRKAYFVEYRQRPNVKSQMLAYSREYRAVPENREKLNLKTRLWRKLPSRMVKRNTVRRAWAAREKQKAVEYKGGCCQLCGYSRCLAALDFHHKDPSVKDGYGTGALKSHWTFEKNRPELDKCVLVCVRCHREIHAGFHPQYLERSAQ